jgi:hypothetical protein
MMRLLRRKVVRLRKDQWCPTCERPICRGEEAVKTEYAQALPHGGESIVTEYDCCSVHKAKEVRAWTGHNVWAGRVQVHGPQAIDFLVREPSHA